MLRECNEARALVGPVGPEGPPTACDDSSAVGGASTLRFFGPEGPPTIGSWFPQARQSSCLFT